MTENPNILLFLSDDHAQWASGCYGDPFADTPNIDYLAARGVQMMDAYTPTPVCSPARACLFTGRTASQHGLHDYIGTSTDLDDNKAWLKEERILPQLLQKAGYHTGVIGKWHLGEEKKAKQGFHYACTLGPEYPIYHWGPRTFYRGNERVEKDGYLASSITDEALIYLKEKRDPEKPFFLTVGHYAAHSPWQGHPDRIVETFRNKPIPRYSEDNVYPFGSQRNESLFNTRLDHKEALCQYYGGIREIDISLGLIMDQLASMGVLENTVLIYTSDHGLNCGHHGLWGKGNATFPLNMVEESIRIPMIFYSPSSFFEGQKRGEMVDHTDLFNTLSALAGLKEDEMLKEERNSPGRSFLHLLKNSPLRGEWRDIQFCEYGPVRMARKGKYKVVLYPEGQPDLFFNLKADPREEKNRWDDPQLLDIQQELCLAIEKHYAQFREVENDGTNYSGLPKFNLLAAWQA